MWPFKPKPKTEKSIHIEVINRDPLRLKLHEFRCNKNLVASAQKVVNDPAFRLMLDVIRNEHPAFWVHGNPTIEQRAAVQAQSEGYTMAIANLESLAVFRNPVELGTPTFEPETVEK